MRPIRTLLSLVALSLLVACGPGLDGELDELAGLIDEREFDAAESSARALLARVEAEQGDSSVEAARVLDELAEVRWRTGRAGDETLALVQRAVRIKQAELGQDAGALCPSLNNLAIVHLFNGRFEEAEAVFARAVSISETAFGEDHPETATLLNGRANNLSRMGDLAGARDMFARALRIREASFGPEHPSVAQSQQNLSLALTDMGDYVGALPIAERAVELNVVTRGPNHPETAGALNALAGLLLDVGDHEAARPHLARAREIYERDADAHRELLGSVLNNEGEVLRRAGDLEGARQRYERVLELWTQVYGEGHPDLAIPLGNLGDVAGRLGDVARAVELHARAVELREATLDHDDFMLAGSRRDLAGSLLAAGRHDEAETLFRTVVVSLERSLGELHPDLARGLVGLARTRAARGDGGEALELALRSETIAREHRRLTGRAMAEASALRYAVARESGLDLALALASTGRSAAEREAVLDAQIRSRAIVLDGVAARHRASLLQDDPETRRLARRLQEARATLAGAVTRGSAGLSIDEYRETLDRFTAAKRLAERELAALSSEFAAELERSRIGLIEVREQLPAGSALVAFALVDRPDPLATPDPAYVAFVLPAGRNAPQVVRLGPVSTLDPLVAAWKRQAVLGARTTEASAGRRLEAYREAGEALRRAAWDPVARRLAGAERVFVVPDGSLNLVSWSSLPVGRDTYLIERGPAVHFLSAERDLVPDASRAELGSGLLALGGADYDGGEAGSPGDVALRGAGDGCANLADRWFEPLDGAEREVRELVESWNRLAEGSGLGAAVALSGVDADEPSFRRAAAGKRVLHLATHGYFLDDDCSLTAAGTRGISFEAPTRPVAAPVRVSPFLLSGLALAGANRREDHEGGEDDGILTAEEIAGLDLSRVEWAVLSACNTGVGEIQPGEGVLGLRRAAQIAGVRTLIMSLWPVDDDATRDWMDELYRARFARRLDTVESVRAAGRAVLASRRDAGQSTHPFFWAGFVAAGDWR